MRLHALQAAATALHTQARTHHRMTWLDDSIHVVFAVFIVLIMLLLAKWLFDATSGLMGRGHHRVTWKNMIIVIVVSLVVMDSLWEISQPAWLIENARILKGTVLK